MRHSKDRKIDFSDIAEWTVDDFKRARRSTPEDRARFRAAFIGRFGQPPPKRGPLPKPASERYVPTFIKLHPRIVQWAKDSAKRRHIGYQTLINETLLRHAA